jgi:hypothetical protein
MNAGKK